MHVLGEKGRLEHLLGHCTVDVTLYSKSYCVLSMLQLQRTRINAEDPNTYTHTHYSKQHHHTTADHDTLSRLRQHKALQERFISSYQCLKIPYLFSKTKVIEPEYHEGTQSRAVPHPSLQPSSSSPLPRSPSSRPLVPINAPHAHPSLTPSVSFYLPPTRPSVLPPHRYYPRCILPSTPPCSSHVSSPRPSPLPMTPPDGQ